MRLSHNMASQNVYREYARVLSRQSSSLEKITSGYKINKAKDNPNAIAQSEKLAIQIRGMQVASKNSQDGISMLQTTEGGLDNITSMTQRIRELTVQSGGGANNQNDKETIQKEIGQLVKGIRDIINNTEFNGIKLLVDDGLQLNMQVGANVDEKIKIPKVDFSSDLNLLNNMDITKPNGAENALEIVEGFSEKVLSIRSKYGALENRFESSYQSLGEISDRITGAESCIRDVDIAQETYEYAKDSLLVNAGLAMMVQSNKFPQDVLRILDKR